MILFSAPNKLPAAPVPLKLCSYTCGALCSLRQSLPSYIMQNKKVWWNIFLGIVSLTPLWGTADLRPHLCVCLPYRMLCHKSPAPSEMEGVVYTVSAHRWQGKTAFQKASAFTQVGNAPGGQEAQGDFTDHIQCKKICEVERPGSKAALHGSFSRAWVWGRYFFSDLWSISSLGGQNLLSIKKLPQSG